MSVPSKPDLESERYKLTALLNQINSSSSSSRVSGNPKARDSNLTQYSSTSWKAGTAHSRTVGTVRSVAAGVGYVGASSRVPKYFQSSLKPRLISAVHAVAVVFSIKTLMLT